MAEVLSGGAAGPIGVSPVIVAGGVDCPLTGIPWPVPIPGNPRLAARSLGQPGRPAVRAAAAALAPRGRGAWFRSAS